VIAIQKFSIYKQALI